MLKCQSAVIAGTGCVIAYLLRACVVNFRTTTAVMAQMRELIVEIGQRLDAKIRGAESDTK